MTASAQNQDQNCERARRLASPYACGYRDAYNSQPAGGGGAEYSEGYAEGEAAARLRDKDSPFTLHEVWDDSRRTFEYEIRHSGTTQSRYRYRLHAEAVLTAWNARCAAQVPA